MPIAINMPRLSDTMEQGTLIKWNVQVGDQIASGDVLADVETDKATMELQSYDDGVVAQLAVSEGDTLAVGHLIALLATDGETAEQAISAHRPDGQAGTAQEEDAKSQETQANTTSQSPAEQATSQTVSGAHDQGQIIISPLARKLAQQQGLDVSAITGTGPGGRIIKRDVQAAGTATAPTHASAAAAPPSSPSLPPPQTKATVYTPGTLEAKTVPVSNMRKTIARRLLESKTTIPHFTVTVTVDALPMLACRAQANRILDGQGQGLKLSVNDFIVKASALALTQFPDVNASWTDGGIAQKGSVNIGIAVALPREKGGGLVVPTIRDCQNKSVGQISIETKSLAKKARQQGLSLAEMSDGTFTISNLGMLGVEHFEAIINPPQAAILAVGAAMEKPVVRDGQIMLGNEMTCTLSGDHRVVDGAMAAEFLQCLKHYLENPAGLLIQ